MKDIKNKNTDIINKRLKSEADFDEVYNKHLDSFNKPVHQNSEEYKKFKPPRAWWNIKDKEINDETDDWTD